MREPLSWTWQCELPVAVWPASEYEKANDNAVPSILSVFYLCQDCDQLLKL